MSFCDNGETDKQKTIATMLKQYYLRYRGQQIFKH